MAEPNFEIIIINPTNDYIINTLNLEIRSFEKEKNAKIMINDKIITNTIIKNELETITLDDIKLKPGRNIIVFDTNEYEIWTEPIFNTEHKASFVVESIILEN